MQFANSYITSQLIYETLSYDDNNNIELHFPYSQYVNMQRLLGVLMRDLDIDIHIAQNIIEDLIFMVTSEYYYLENGEDIWNEDVFTESIFLTRPISVIIKYVYFIKTIMIANRLPPDETYVVAGWLNNTDCMCMYI